MISDVQLAAGIEILQQHHWTKNGPEKCLSPHLSLLQIMNTTVYNNYYRAVFTFIVKPWS